ncbi:MAG: DUF1858 domain-containing protein [Desulfuromonadales bacterium]|uniref:DUF1858 domain-containing protein n=1 Tax=Desulfuromonas sp. KJ2020 TaxID=2919173 RepID=UPI00032104AE|nr:DUF1858 domain-containing protein [Desulfuromonas sp. KJ2020]MCP3177909.1 DUF1858 domain-containing protein [Desulfuromonas sp. KJ2020]
MITKEMTIGQILREHPETIAVFKRFGLDCHTCQIASLESVECGAEVHQVDTDALVSELNSAIKK